MAAPTAVRGGSLQTAEDREQIVRWVVDELRELTGAKPAVKWRPPKFPSMGIGATLQSLAALANMANAGVISAREMNKALEQMRPSGIDREQLEELLSAELARTKAPR